MTADRQCNITYVKWVADFVVLRGREFLGWVDVSFVMHDAFAGVDTVDASGSEWIVLTVFVVPGNHCTALDGHCEYCNACMWVWGKWEFSVKLVEIAEVDDKDWVFWTCSRNVYNSVCKSNGY